MMLGAHLLVYQVSPKKFWSQHLAVQQPSWFLSVMCEEDFWGLRVQDVEVLILFAALFLPSQSYILKDISLLVGSPNVDSK
jgi:hypothetical protein